MARQTGLIGALLLLAIAGAGTSAARADSLTPDLAKGQSTTASPRTLIRDCKDCPLIVRRTLQDQARFVTIATHTSWYKNDKPEIEYTEDVVDFGLQGLSHFLAGSSCPETSTVAMPTMLPVRNDVLISPKITSGDWRRCSAKGLCIEQDGAKGEPVHVAFDDALAYQNLIKRESGHDYRVPTLDDLLMLAGSKNAGNEATSFCSGVFDGRGSWELSSSCVDAKCQSVWAFREADAKCVPIAADRRSTALAFRVLRSARERNRR
jgi:hypothetical protein